MHTQSRHFYELSACVLDFMQTTPIRLVDSNRWAPRPLSLHHAYTLKRITAHVRIFCVAAPVLPTTAKYRQAHGQQTKGPTWSSASWRLSQIHQRRGLKAASAKHYRRQSLIAKSPGKAQLYSSQISKSHNRSGALGPLPLAYLNRRQIETRITPGVNPCDATNVRAVQPLLCFIADSPLGALPATSRSEFYGLSAPREHRMSRSRSSFRPVSCDALN